MSPEPSNQSPARRRAPTAASATAKTAKTPASKPRASTAKATRTASVVAGPARLTLAAADAVVAAARAEAEAIGQPMNIAVVDAGGHLVAFARMDGAIFASIDISQRKAYTAAAMKRETKGLAAATQPGAPLYGLELLSGGLVTFAGGIPLPGPDGEPLGAIGVSAGSVEQDQQVAEAGVAGFPKA